MEGDLIHLGGLFHPLRRYERIYSSEIFALEIFTTRLYYQDFSLSFLDRVDEVKQPDYEPSVQVNEFQPFSGVTKHKIKSYQFESCGMCQNNKTIVN